MYSKNTTYVNFRRKNSKKFLCYVIIIDISGITCYLENLHKVFDLRTKMGVGTKGNTGKSSFTV